MEECKYFKTCSAPICPMLSDAVDNATWYPDEPICKRRGIPFVSTQKRIASICNSSVGYFTGAMLKRIVRVRNGIKGISPDDNPDKLIKTWLARHPESAVLAATDDSCKSDVVNEKQAVRAGFGSIQNQTDNKTHFKNNTSPKPVLQVIGENRQISLFDGGVL